MKKEEKLQDAIGMIGDDLIREARTPKKRTRKALWTAVTAACLALCV